MLTEKHRKWAMAILILLIAFGVVWLRILPLPKGQIAYETIKGKACLVSGIQVQCTIPQVELDLPPDRTFLDIYERTGLLELNGKGNILLTEVALAHYLFPRWSPDNSVIVYASPDHTSICLADTTGSNERCFDTGLNCVGEYSWSPSGNQIAFAAVKADTSGCSSLLDLEWGIYVFDIHDMVFSDLIDNANYPAWSPDGQQIAFTTLRDGNNEIYVVDADSSNFRRLTAHPANDFAPAWSPDGEKIAFLSDRGLGSVNVSLADSYPKLRMYIIDADGGPTRLLLSRLNDSIERFVWGE